MLAFVLIGCSMTSTRWDALVNLAGGACLSGSSTSPE
jgi:hypothetical protein